MVPVLPCETLKPSISKVWSMLHHGLVGRVHSREYYFIFTYTFLAFFFSCFSWKEIVFLPFSFFFFFWMKYWIYFTECWPMRNRHRWQEIVSRTVCKNESNDVEIFWKIYSVKLDETSALVKVYFIIKNF